MQHVDEGTLQAWLDHPRSALSDDEVAAVEAHLSECEACAARVQALEEESAHIAALLGASPSSAPPPFAAIEARAERLDQVGAPSGGRRPRSWRGAAWAASVAVALGTGWMANELFRTDPGARSGFSEESVVAPAPAPESDIEMPPPPEAEEESSPMAAAENEAAPPETEGATAQADGVPASADAAPARARRVAEPAPAPPPPETVIRGRVVDATSGQPLESAQIFEPTSGTGTLTDAAGTFALTLPEAAAASIDSAVTLQVQLIGYGQADRRVDLTAKAPVELPDVEMESTALRLQELVVTGASDAAPPLTLDPDAAAWTPADRATAEALAGFALRTVPELPVAEVATSTHDGAVVVRVVQTETDGSLVTLLQSSRGLALSGIPAGPEGLAVGWSNGVSVAVILPAGSGGAANYLSRLR